MTPAEGLDRGLANTELIRSSGDPTVSPGHTSPAGDRALEGSVVPLAALSGFVAEVAPEGCVLPRVGKGPVTTYEAHWSSSFLADAWS